MTTTTHQLATPDRLEKAHRFHALHQDGTLVLPNAWDAASARLVQDAGASAVATTSAGLSWSLGAPDGERVAWSDALGQLRRIVAAVTLPVSADVEGGFDDLDRTVTDVLEAGAVGINIEDACGGALRPAEDMAARVARVRSVADGHGVPLFVNARVDTYLLDVPDKEAETLRRARAYVDAGADGVFVPGASDAAWITALVTGITVPLNIMVGPGSLPVAELRALGVRRVSAGAVVASAAYAIAHRASTELLEQGTYGTLRDAGGHPPLNALLARE